MNIKEAIKNSLSKGNHITLSNWNGNIYLKIEYCRNKKTLLPYIFKHEGDKGKPWVTNDEELASDDWIEVYKKGDESYINTGMIFLALKKAYIANYVQPGGILHPRKGEEISKKFNTILEQYI